MSLPDPAEQTFLDEGAIRVTNARFIAGRRTYAMHGITAVSFHVKRQGWIAPLLLAAIALFFSVVVLSPGADDALVPLICVSLIMWFFTFALWFGLRPSYSVRLTTASGESEALTSRDRARIQRVIDALNDAIVARGGS